ncbi:MAG: hypothetical protein ACTTIC_04975 [Helicobacteraceae bacterium]
MKILNFFAVLSAAVLLLSCADENSRQAKQLERNKHLDNGDYDWVIRELGDCANPNKSQSEQASCLAGLSDAEKIDLGAAYYGKSGYTLVDLAKDLSKNKDEDGVTRAIFSRLMDENIKLGASVFEQILEPKKAKDCTYENYKNGLSGAQKQACLSLNPLLIRDILDKKGSGSGINLKDLATFNGLTKIVSPELDGDALARVLTNKEPSKKDDVNDDKKIDSVQATQCIIKTCDDGVTNDHNDTVQYKGVKNGDKDYTDINLSKVRVVAKSGSGLSDAIFHRWTNGNTVLATENGAFCNNKAEKKTGCKEYDYTKDCYTCPKVRNGKFVGLAEAMTENIDDNLLQTVADAKYNKEGGSKQEKLEKLKKELCGEADAANCKTGAGGKLDQSKLMEYLTKK